MGTMPSRSDRSGTIAGRAYPLGAKNVDTDVIIPARWLKTITREGLGKGAFESLRAKQGNVFEDPRFAGAPILIAGENFGCGSSREHAAWALLDMGIRAVIAPSFSDIFASNAFKNGIVTVELPQEAIDRLLEIAPESQITIDLEAQTVTSEFQDRFAFAMDPFRKRCLIEGLDEIALTLERETAIARFEQQRADQMGWIARGTQTQTEN